METWNRWLQHVNDVALQNAGRWWLMSSLNIFDVIKNFKRCQSMLKLGTDILNKRLHTGDHTFWYPNCPGQRGTDSTCYIDSELFQKLGGIFETIWTSRNMCTFCCAL